MRHDFTTPGPARVRGGRAAIVLAAVLLAGAGGVHAETVLASTLQGGPLVARASIDFRITVLPSIGLDLRSKALAARSEPGADVRPAPALSRRGSVPQVTLVDATPIGVARWTVAQP